jgi:cytochrome c-type biogenesis protein CcmE
MNTAKLKLLVGGVLIAGGIGYMAYLAGLDSAQYAITPKQYVADPAKWKDRGLRFAGLAGKGSYHHEGAHHTFDIVDAGDLQASIDAEKNHTAAVAPSVIAVSFDGTMPDTFEEELKVIVEGKMAADGKTLVASSVIPQCKSKYEGVKPGYNVPEDHRKDVMWPQHHEATEPAKPANPPIHASADTDAATVTR